MALDDLPLDPSRDHEPAARPSAPSSSGPTIAVIAVVVIALAVAGWLLFPRSTPAPAAVAAADDAAPAAAVPATPAAAPPLPPLGEMDPVVRGLLAAISTHPELMKWLATDDLVGSMATGIARLSAGESPSRDLAALRPGAGFTTTERNGVTRIDPSSYARYAPLADLAASVDAGRLAAAFTTLRPRIVEAWTAQGHDPGQFDAALRRALEVVRTTPDLPPDAVVVPAPGGFAYADPTLERLPAAQKHLMRMGPDAVRAIRDAADRFAAALGTTSATAP